MDLFKRQEKSKKLRKTDALSRGGNSYQIVSLFKKGSTLKGKHLLPITKTHIFKYIENFTTKKMKNFQMKNSGSFQISAQNIDCGYLLEPPQRGGSNEYPQSMVLSRK